MPSRRSVMAAGRYDLHHAIQYHGGYTQVLPKLLHLAKALPIQPKWPAHAQVCCLKHQHHHSSLSQEWQSGAMACTMPSSTMSVSQTSFQPHVSLLTIPELHSVRHVALSAWQQVEGHLSKPRVFHAWCLECHSLVPPLCRGAGRRDAGEALCMAAFPAPTWLGYPRECPGRLQQRARGAQAANACIH
jgi:hypothetical protein